MCEKTEAEALRERLSMKNEHFMKDHGDELSAADAFCEGYKVFLQRAKTERECNCAVIEKAKSRGFVPFDPFGSYRCGDKVYLDNRGKSVILCVFGKKSVSEGLRIVASHIDSPRLDLKPTPLYEDTELAYFKTHYYGGIRKYQWAAIPLSLHGVFIKKDGTAV
ncbi:MAG: aminopeptidase, partial [Clostridia bacterium]|nr:aminopeptidase [Clostridia bacterium]